LLERDPAALQQLYRNFPFNRQHGRALDDALTVSHPIFATEGLALAGRPSRQQMLYSYQIPSQERHAEARHALDRR